MIKGINRQVVEVRETGRTRWFRACKPRGDAWILLQVGGRPLEGFEMGNSMI